MLVPDYKQDQRSCYKTDLSYNPTKGKLYTTLCCQACRENLLLHMFWGICVYVCGREVGCYCMYALYDTDYWHNSVNSFIL
jgi:hypothetical protein